MCGTARQYAVSMNRNKTKIICHNNKITNETKRKKKHAGTLNQLDGV